MEKKIATKKNFQGSCACKNASEWKLCSMKQEVIERKCLSKRKEQTKKTYEEKLPI